MRTTNRNNSKTWTPEEAKSRVIDARRPHCPHCDSVAEIKTSEEFYGKNYDSCVWYCPSCTDMYVGTHKGTNRALGIMADKNTRTFRKIAHKELDYKWKVGTLKRSDLYEWIAVKLDIAKEEAHIGNFSIEQCKQLIAIARKEQFEATYGHIFNR